ncbi:hypothetical protein SUGI_0772670 [Cryptomeria japonica]|nr:hypothetical protein SUGI_0772670 [Cryptomeria japonica]
MAICACFRFAVVLVQIPGLAFIAPFLYIAIIADWRLPWRLDVAIIADWRLHWRLDIAIIADWRLQWRLDIAIRNMQGKL